MANIKQAVTVRAAFMKKKIARLFLKSARMKFFYGRYYKHTGVVDNRILFESFHGSTVSDSPLYILKELVRRGDADKYEIFYSSNDDDMKAHRQYIEANDLPVKLISVTSYKYCKILATSKYLINNSSFPVYFIKKEDQVYLQTWHGTPLKTLGKQMRLGIESMYNVQHNFLQADYLMHPNEFTKDAIMRDYNLNGIYTGKVALCGYPRNSIFMDTLKASAIKRQLKLEKYTTYAYMPTWRGTSNHSVNMDAYSHEVNKMLKKIDRSLTSDEILFVNFHPILKDSVTIEGYEHIRQFPVEVDKYEFLNSCDALITDYSSVFFDYSVTRKPVILFMYDYDQYMHDRGTYFDIKELPFVKLYHIKDLCEYLSTKKILSCTYDSPEYVDKFIKYDSIDTPAKMLDLVLYGKTDGLKIEDYSANKEKKLSVLHPVYRLKNAGDFKNIADNVKDNQLVLLERSWFNPTLSSILYDNYNDAFNYVIISNTTPRTYTEEVLDKLGSKRVHKALAMRELKRTFPGLDIKYPYEENFYSAEEGASVPDTKYPLVSEIVRYTYAELSGDTHEARLSVKEKGVKPLKLVINDNKRTIIHTRELSQEEQNGGYIRLDYADFSDRLQFRARYDIGAEMEDTETGEHFFTYFYDKRFEKYNEKNIEKYPGDDAFLEPVLLPFIGVPEFRGKYRNIETAVVTLPFKRELRNSFSFVSIEPGLVVNESISAHITKVKSYRSKAVIFLKLRKMPGMTVKNVCMRYRNAETYDVPAEYTITEGGKYFRIKAEIDFNKAELRELYWDFRILVEKFGHENEVKCAFRTGWYKFKFYITNIQYSASEGHMAFPYYTKSGCLAFMYRQDSPYDKNATVRKEILASICYAFGGFFIKRKAIWLVYEKFCQMAQDNGYYFFKYCMDHLTPEENKNIYYVIDKKAPDYEKVKKYGKHVIQFMSFKHILYCLAASCYVGSDSRNHLYAWRCKTSLIRSKMNSRRMFFLQHGVTALKRDAHLFGMHGSSPMTYFAVTSEFEQGIITRYFDYNEVNVPITGFARWDVLEDKQDPHDRMILLMPTWRSWLEEVTDEDFLASDYFRNYSAFLNSKELSDVLEKNDTRMVFYIHPKFAGYLKNFDIKNRNVSLIPFGEKPLNEIMMKCSALITDYSSVCWDVYYLKKPVIFYQFDLDKYNEAHGSYIDMEKDLFGRRAVDMPSLISEIRDVMEKGFTMLPDDEKKHGYYFKYIDDQNSKRTYKFLINQER
jgi:CDP-glycerol glycerophosphotransferase (TagB/SpsB family)